MATEGLPSVEVLQDLGKNADVYNEVVTSEDDLTESVASDGEQKTTLVGLGNKYQDSIDSFESDGQVAIDDFNDNGQAALDAFDAQQTAALSAAGYTIAGTFADGATLTSRSEALYYAGDASDNYKYQGFYVWTGTFNKVVSAGSTPQDETGWSLAATGYTKQTGAIQLFGQTIDADISIPTGQNALSINPTVSEDVSVTVPEGSQWVILGATD